MDTSNAVQHESVFKNAVGDLPANISSSEGSDQSERGDGQKGKYTFRRNPNYRQVPHRRYQSLPGGYAHPVPPLYQPNSARAAGPVEFPPPQMPVYHPWVSGYDVQWSAYGMYVHSTVMSKRSEKPTRIVYIGNLSPNVKEKHVIEAASKFGTLRGVDASLREYWFGMFVSYWDTRHAEEAVRGLPELVPGVGSDDTQRIPCSTFFMMPPSVAGMENQGLLTVKIEQNVTSTIVRKLFSKFGDVKSVRTVSEEAKAVEFYDARAAEAAVMELKGSKEHRAVVKDLEITSVVQPETTNAALYNNGKVDESGSSDGDVTQSGPWPVPSAPYPTTWGQYSVPPQHYGGEIPPLQRQHSAPAAGYTDHYSMRRPDAVWPGHYMGYPPHGMHPWPYAGGHHPPAVPLVPVSGRFDGLHRVESHPGSPGYESHASDHAWRPHRTRSTGDRVYDPAQFQFNLAEANNDPSAARTTLMIRNIPNKYSQKMLLDVLNKKYSGRFDFFYLPIDFKNRCNLGYAFVNFIDAATTVEFYKEFHTKSWEEFNSKKVCEITYARVQGRDCLIEHFRNSRFPCNDPDYLPLVFEIEAEGQKTGSKGTPVHHWATNNYPENHAAVAAH